MKSAEEWYAEYQLQRKDELVNGVRRKRTDLSVLLEEQRQQYVKKQLEIIQLRKALGESIVEDLAMIQTVQRDARAQGMRDAAALIEVNESLPNDCQTCCAVCIETILTAAEKVSKE